MTVVVRALQMDAVPALLQLAASQHSSHDGKNSFTVLTVGAINYKDVVLNWIHHLQLHKVEKYIVVCTDREIFAEVGASHGVLVEYNVNATLTYQKIKYPKKKRKRSRYERYIIRRESAQETGSSKVADLQTRHAPDDGEPVEAKMAASGVRGRSLSTIDYERASLKKPERSERTNAPVTVTKKIRRYLLGSVEQAVQKESINGMNHDFSDSKPNKMMKNRRRTTQINSRTQTTNTNSFLKRTRADSTRYLNFTRSASSYSSNKTRYLANQKNNVTSFRNSTINRMMPPLFRSNSSESKWKFDNKKAFSIMMYIKYSSLLTLLSAGHSVVWSDVDCVWVKMCAVNFLATFAVKDAKWYNRHKVHGRQLTSHLLQGNQTELNIQDELDKLAKAKVDIASQQGSSPFKTSEVIGTAICTGFFVVNPSPASLLLIAAVQQTMISSVDGSCGRNCSVDDQSVVNGLLMKYGNLQEWADQNSKIMYGPSHVTNNHREETHFLHTNLTFPHFMVNHEQHSQLSPGKRLVSGANTPIAIAFLPYDLFPRGDSRVNATAWELLVRKSREHGNTTNTTAFRGPVKNKLMTSSEANKKNANEWNDLKEYACIWHMYSKKDGDTKVLAMIRDGVYTRDQIDESEEQE
jgi:hypothetical protein